MSSMTDFLENKIADHLFRATSYSKPATLYYALFTVAPSDAGGGTEVTGGSYARVAVTVNDTNFNGTHGNTTGASSGTSGVISNAVAITFPAPTANWGTAVSWAIMDAASAGNMLFEGALQANKTINNGDAAPSFTAGSFTMTFA
jgi:hypothetical protein